MKKTSSAVLCLVLPVCVTIQAEDFTGVSTGVFQNLQGNASLDHTILEVVSTGVNTSNMTLGAPNQPGDAPDNFQFQGTAVSGFVNSDFPIGTFRYENGRTVIGSSPKQFDLAMSLDLGSTNVGFVFTFDLEITMNEGTPEENADYVRFLSSFSPTPIDIDGSTYYLKLTFGQTTPGGFSEVTQFHVLEEESATAELRGVITDRIPEPSVEIFGAVSIRYKTERGFLYQVQNTTDLEQAWSPYGPVLEGDGSTMQTSISPVSSGHRFFRVAVYHPWNPPTSVSFPVAAPEVDSLGCRGTNGFEAWRMAHESFVVCGGGRGLVGGDGGGWLRAGGLSTGPRRSDVHRVLGGAESVYGSHPGGLGQG